MLQMYKRYYELVDKRDAVNKQNETVRAKIDALSAQIIELQGQQAKLVEELNRNRGGEAWISLKREIGVLARGLVKIPPREEVAAMEKQQ